LIATRYNTNCIGAYLKANGKPRAARILTEYDLLGGTKRLVGRVARGLADIAGKVENSKF
jgi:hypothetical protein